MQQLVQIRGRGAPQNPRNRFEAAEYVADGDWLDTLEDDEPGPRTQFLRDHTRGIIARNDSPDIPFTASVNPYRGCEHGCTGREARSWIETSAESPFPLWENGSAGTRHRRIEVHYS